MNCSMELPTEILALFNPRQPEHWRRFYLCAQGAVADSGNRTWLGSGHCHCHPDHAAGWRAQAIPTQTLRTIVDGPSRWLRARKALAGRNAAAINVGDGIIENGTRLCPKPAACPRKKRTIQGSRKRNWISDASLTKPVDYGEKRLQFGSRIFLASQGQAERDGRALRLLPGGG